MRVNKSTEKVSSLTSLLQITYLMLTSSGILHLLVWLRKTLRIQQSDRKLIADRKQQWRPLLQTLTKNIFLEEWSFRLNLATLTTSLKSDIIFNDLVFSFIEKHPKVSPFKIIIPRDTFLLILREAIKKTPQITLTFNRKTSLILDANLDDGIQDKNKFEEANNYIIEKLGAYILSSSAYQQYQSKIRTLTASSKVVMMNGHRKKDNPKKHTVHASLSSSMTIQKKVELEILEVDQKDAAESSSEADLDPMNDCASTTTASSNSGSNDVRDSQELIVARLASASPTMLEPAIKKNPNWEKIVNAINSVRHCKYVIEDRGRNKVQQAMAWRRLLVLISNLYCSLDDAKYDNEINYKFNPDLLSTIQIATTRSIYCYLNSIHIDRVVSVCWLLGFADVISGSLPKKSEVDNLENCGKLVSNLYQYSLSVIKAFDVNPRLLGIVNMDATYLMPHDLMQAISSELDHIALLQDRLESKLTLKNHEQCFEAFMGSCIVFKTYYTRFQNLAVIKPDLLDQLIKMSPQACFNEMYRFDVMKWLRLLSEFSSISGIDANGNSFRLLYDEDDSLKRSVIYHIAHQLTALKTQLCLYFTTCVWLDTSHAYTPNISMAPR